MQSHLDSCIYVGITSRFTSPVQPLVHTYNGKENNSQIEIIIIIIKTPGITDGCKKKFQSDLGFLIKWKIAGRRIHMKTVKNYLSEKYLVKIENAWHMILHIEITIKPNFVQTGDEEIGKNTKCGRKKKLNKMESVE